MRETITAAAFLAILLAGCDALAPKKGGKQETRAGEKPAREPTETVEGGYVYQLRREYDRDVIAYEKKYQSKWVLLRIERPFEISKSYDEYGIIQSSYQGDNRSGVFVSIRKADADRLSSILGELHQTRPEEKMPRLKVRVKEYGFGFRDGQLVGK